MRLASTTCIPLLSQSTILFFALSRRLSGGCAKCDLSICLSLYLHTFIRFSYFFFSFFSFYTESNSQSLWLCWHNCLSAIFFFIFIFLSLSFSFLTFLLYLVRADQGSIPAMAAMDLTNGTTWEKDYTKNDITNKSNERARVKRTFVEIIVSQCVRYWRRFSTRWHQFIADGHRIKVRINTHTLLTHKCIAICSGTFPAFTFTFHITFICVIHFGGGWHLLAINWKFNITFQVLAQRANAHCWCHNQQNASAST